MPNERNTRSSGADPDADIFPGEQHLDRRWAWVVMVAALLTHILTFGAAYASVGALYVEFLNAFGKSESATALAGSIMLGTMLCSGPLASILVAKFGARVVAVCGGVFASSGLILSAFANGLVYLYFTFGVLTGLGYGFCYLPCIVMVGNFFEKRRAVASGIAVSGSGLGTFIIAPITQSLLEAFGFRKTLIVLGAIELILCVCGATYLPGRIPVRKMEQEGICVDVTELGSGSVLTTSILESTTALAKPSEVSYLMQAALCSSGMSYLGRSRSHGKETDSIAIEDTGTTTPLTRLSDGSVLAQAALCLSRLSPSVSSSIKSSSSKLSDTVLTPVVSTSSPITLIPEEWITSETNNDNTLVPRHKPEFPPIPEEFINPSFNTCESTATVIVEDIYKVSNDSEKGASFLEESTTDTAAESAKTYFKSTHVSQIQTLPPCNVDVTIPGIQMISKESEKGVTSMEEITTDIDAEESANTYCKSTHMLQILTSPPCNVDAIIPVIQITSNSEEGNSSEESTNDTAAERSAHNCKSTHDSLIPTSPPCNVDAIIPVIQTISNDSEKEITSMEDSTTDINAERSANTYCKSTHASQIPASPPCNIDAIVPVIQMISNDSEEGVSSKEESTTDIAAERSANTYCKSTHVSQIPASPPCNVNAIIPADMLSNDSESVSFKEESTNDTAAKKKSANTCNSTHDSGIPTSPPCNVEVVIPVIQNNDNHGTTVNDHSDSNDVPTSELNTRSSSIICPKSSSHSTQSNGCMGQVLTIARLFKNRYFILFSLSNLFVCIGYQLPYMYFKAFALSMGLGDDAWALILSIMGVADTLGRILVGFCFEHVKTDNGRLLGYVASMVISGAILALTSFASSYVSLLCFAAGFALVAGSTDSLVAALLVGFVGLDTLGYSFGMTIEMQGIGFIMGPPIAGFLYSVTGTYTAIFCTGGVAFILSGLVLLLEPLIAHLQNET